MRAGPEVSAVLAACLALAPWATAEARPNPGASNPQGRQPLLYKSRPIVLNVARLSDNIDTATVSDVEVADFDGDGRNDIVVAWYATDYSQMSANVRTLTFFFNRGTTFERGPDINLYIADYNFPAKSVFRNGTADVAMGDFDGDGDLDLAVPPFFGDELWFIENLGNREFTQHLRFPFGFNSTGNFLTPPEALAADFDGDGRAELVYLADPILHVDGQVLHFWKTAGAIHDIYRVYWEALDDDVPTDWTRGLAAVDFDGDRRPDLCFSGASNPPQEDGPVLTFWYGLDTATGRFSVHHEFPDILCSDVVDARPTTYCLPGVILTDPNGTTMQYWAGGGAGPMNFVEYATVTGYAGLSPNRGMTAVVADVDGDGNLDLITKQKLGTATNANQIEITRSSEEGAIWTRADPTPIDTTGFQNDPNNQILRPRNLTVGDLIGNTLPEIVAGFAARPTRDDRAGNRAAMTLDIAIWENGCLGDVDRNGRTDAADVRAVVRALGTSRHSPGFNPDADLDKDGVVSESDLCLAASDCGCGCDDHDDWQVGDTDCDGNVGMADIDAFVVALFGQAAYMAQYPNCNWLNADCNGDGAVDCGDIDPFVALLCCQRDHAGHGL